MKFLVQHNLMSRDQLALIKSAIEDYPHEFVGLIPFSRDITSKHPLEGQDYIPYGSTTFTNVAHELGWKGLHFNLKTFNYTAATENRRDMLNGNLFIDTIKRGILFLKEEAEPNSLWFVRPSEDLKQFPGQVMNREELIDFLTDVTECESSGSYKLEFDTEIVISTPKTIDAEWRWFIIGGKIVDGSMYRCNGQFRKVHETGHSIIKEAQSFADKWLPDPCCVMDLAVVDNKVKVVEFNCINSSGFYDHDVDKIFSSLWKYHQ